MKKILRKKDEELKKGIPPTNLEKLERTKAYLNNNREKRGEEQVELNLVTLTINLLNKKSRKI